MILESPYRRDRLAPRCRLITSWSCNWLQGFGCSPIKVVRELGSERRETVRSLSTICPRLPRISPLVREDWVDDISGSELSGYGMLLPYISRANH